MKRFMVAISKVLEASRSIGNASSVTQSVTRSSSSMGSVKSLDSLTLIVNSAIFVVIARTWSASDVNFAGGTVLLTLVRSISDGLEDVHTLGTNSLNNEVEVVECRIAKLKWLWMCTWVSAWLKASELCSVTKRVVMSKDQDKGFH